MEATNRRERVVNASSSAPTPTLTVAAVARRLGVAPPTLRTWDRRYGLGPSAHTAGAHRRYSPADVARLMVMRRLTLEGVSPADAAKIALATAVSAEGKPMHTPADGYDLSAVEDEALGADRGNDAARQKPVEDDGFHVDAPNRPDFPPLDWPQAYPEPTRLPDPQRPEIVTARADQDEQSRNTPDEDTPDEQNTPDDRTVDDTLVDLALDTDLDDGFGRARSRPDDDPDDWTGVLRSVPTERSSSGGGRVVAMPDGTPQNRGLARAAMSLDTYETHRILREMLRRDGVVPTWNEMIMPVLRALGERTRMTGDGIDVEHAFSEVVLGVMRSIAVGAPHPGNAPVVLLACADSDYHSLPLHALAAALAERDIPTRMLGSGLPPHALSASVRRTGPSVIVLFARMAGADAGDVDALRRQRPAPTVILAGPGWQPETVPSSARTANSLLDAVDEVLRAVHA